MADPADIADETNWYGGFYELALEIGPSDDPRLDAALELLLRGARVAGRVDHGGHLRGVVGLPDGMSVVCGGLAIREDEGPSCWACFYLPLGALERADARVGGYPFGSFERSLEWRLPIDDWLAAVGREVYREVPFRLGKIGMEVSALEIDEAMGTLVPADGELVYTRATI
jgi:hypothetical protein